jgi:hypothetical protein
VDNSTQITTLYRYFDSEGQLLYVGVTKNQFQRQDQHSKIQPWWTDVASATFTHYESRNAAFAAEVYAIANDLPRYNKAGPTISQELKQHLMSVMDGNQADSWHQDISQNMSKVMAEINEFSLASESYKLAFAFDRSIAWGNDGEYRILKCDDCKSICNSSWFQFASYEADGLICDEAGK